ncbi:SDR family NAD(P)-dependent oxidoreductase [Hoyosella altamirensis]|uniref:NAD(P)-dependent dehydrogenase (Short-subunit alcohol dehydrogenase family) n=1 Tax=Hoyosella altamirensis TaxID=616997 RepID=A0A839RJ04_9ACTN|nr:SDR family NAD(P)-dependent oxidoreductase [Hoyosella altamirensis]MBB3036430.1 NAD(P)-dependent dehydrogenase (short-subunit alcohol dehydrogenase family) [Hoyosella altamirensis]
MTASIGPRSARLFARTADAVLEGSVVGGFSRIGFAARRLLPAWPDDPQSGALRDRTALVTGAGSGIGAASALGLARLGARVLLCVRSQEKGDATEQAIRAELPDANIATVICDVSDLASVRKAGRDIISQEPRLDVVVHNAGVLPSHREESADGHEITLATHVLGPILLTEVARPALRASGKGRIIFVSSGGMYTQRVPVEDPEYLSGTYKGATAYARTKRMQVALTPLLAQRWGPEGTDVHSMHPGWADTPGVVDALPGFHKIMKPLLRNAESAADTIVWLAASQPPPPPGRFWHDRRSRAAHRLPGTHQSAEDVLRLWRYCAQALDLSAGDVDLGEG